MTWAFTNSSAVFVKYALLFAMLSLWPALARAELFSFVDDEGVIHFTNMPNDPRYRPLPQNNSNNTFQWKDDLGAWRRIHRVDVTTFDDLILEASRYYSLPPALVKAIMAVESSFEPKALSPAGALGLMQLIPSTAKEMRVADPYDPRANIYGGVRYLRILANRFSGDLRLTIAAYNAGPLAVEKNGGVPPFVETRRYVERVLTLYKHYLTHWSQEKS